MLDPKDKQALEAELAQLPEAKPPAQGSFFRFQSVEVKEKLGSDQAVAQHIAAYAEQFLRRLPALRAIEQGNHLFPPVTHDIHCRLPRMRLGMTFRQTNNFSRHTNS